jgi:hypothetical protein
LFRPGERSCVVPDRKTSKLKKGSSRSIVAYDALCSINRAFEQILKQFERLHQIGWFRGRAPIKSVELAVKETHAWTMFEVTEVLNGFEERNWTRFGRRRRQQDKQLADPNDVLIEAEQVKRDLQIGAGNMARKKR